MTITGNAVLGRFALDVITNSDEISQKMQNQRFKKYVHFIQLCLKALKITISFFGIRKD